MKTLTILVLFVWSLAASAGLFDVPVRKEIRNSLEPATSWIDVQYPQSREAMGQVAGVISGWGFPVGSPTNFNRVTFPMRASVADYFPTKIRVRIRQGDYDGAILADKTQDVFLELGVRKLVSVEFDNTVLNSAVTNLWGEILANGRIDEYQTTVIQYNTPASRYWIDMNIDGPNPTPPAAVNQRNYPMSFFRGVQDTGLLKMTEEFSSYINLSDLISRIVTPTYGIAVDKYVGSPDSLNLWSRSTYSGSGQYVGAVTNVNALAIWVYPWDETVMPSRMRVTLRQMPSNTNLWTNNPATWPILATKTVDLDLALEAFNKVTVRFGSDVSVSGNIWLEYLTNGKDIGRQIIGSSYSPVETPGLWYTTSASIDSTNWIKSPSLRAFPVELGKDSKSLSGYTVTEEFKQQFGSAVTESSVVLSMAPIYYAIQGREANIYFDNIIMSSLPLANVIVDVSGSQGEQFGSFGGFWRVTPATSSSNLVAMSTTIFDPLTSEILSSNVWNLKLVASNAPAVPVSRQLLCIGDSTLGGSGAAVLAEVVRLFSTDTNYTLTLVGSNDGLFPDSTGSNRMVRCDAISGWTAGRLHTNSTDAWTEIGGTARVGSPFVFSGVFNMTNWAASNSVTFASNDWVLIHLGINDVFSATTDAGAIGLADACIGNIDGMISKIRSYNGNIRIVVCSTIPPNGSQDGFGGSYGVGQTRRRYKRNRDLLNQRLQSRFVARTAEKIHYMDYGAHLDAINNYTTSITVANSRSTNSWSKATAASGVHPDPSGYYQLADAIRAFLKGNE